MGNLRVGVLGAGIVGITTALELQKEFPSASVCVVADKFGENTTSNGAAGIFRPATNFLGPSADITSKWIEDSYHFYENIRLSVESPQAGVFQVSGYMFSNISQHLVRNHYLEHLVPLYRNATQDELSLCPGNWKYGSYFTTLITECRKFLPWGYEKFTERGGRMIEMSITSFSDLTNDYDVVVNCLGLGAKHVCSDPSLVPIRGQVIKVKAPWIKTFFYADFDTYIIPGMESVTLGGCRQYDSYSLDISKHDTAAIMERCTAFIPSLKKAPILKEWAGLRPHRSSVRVETEEISGLKVIHNYGHGGYGVTTAPGTSKHAVKLVRDVLTMNCKL